MPSLESRMRALRALYVLAFLGGAAYVGLQEQAWGGAALLAFGGCFKARVWLSPWFAARRALGGPWRTYTEGPFETLVPYGWTARVTDTRDLLLEGDDVSIRAVCCPASDGDDGSRQAATFLAHMGESMKLRDHRPCEGSVGGLPAIGQAATVATFGEIGTLECLGARWSDGRVLVVISWRALSVPRALLTRCMDGVHLRPLT